MALMSTVQFDEFFEPYARNVEGFYEAAYWTLADEVIKELIRRHLGVAPGDRVLDAGGGTGRWAVWLTADQQVQVTVADKSAAMLAEAERNIAAAPGDPPVDLVLCDLHDAPDLPTAGYDAAISTYGVLSFVDDPPRVFETLYRVLKPGAVGLLMSHSLSTALATKLSRNLAGPDEVTELDRTRTVRWAPDVPPLRVFTAQDLTNLADDAGFTVDGVFGVTALVQPGAEDFGYPYQEISRVSKALENPEFFQKALELELAAAENPDWAERGVNLMVKVRKPGRTVPYSALAAVYDRWTADNDYGRWAQFISDRLPHDRSRVLDVCCGTGTLVRHLSSRGHRVTGIDRSAEMLAVARSGVPEAVFVTASVPEDLSGELGDFDAATCTFDSLNYLVEDGALADVFVRLARLVRPGGVFVFDVNTRHKLTTVFGDSHYGDDLGDFAYVWRNRTDVDRGVTEFHITLFTSQGPGITRATEHHVQRWFSRGDVAEVAAAAGFTVESVVDDYGDRPAGDDTMRETWVLRRTV